MYVTLLYFVAKAVWYVAQIGISGRHLYVTLTSNVLMFIWCNRSPKKAYRQRKKVVEIACLSFRSVTLTMDVKEKADLTAVTQSNESTQGIYYWGLFLLNWLSSFNMNWELSTVVIGQVSPCHWYWLSSHPVFIIVLVIRFCYSLCLPVFKTAQIKVLAEHSCLRRQPFKEGGGGVGKLFDSDFKSTAPEGA